MAGVAGRQLPCDTKTGPGWAADPTNALTHPLFRAFGHGTECRGPIDPYRCRTNGIDSDQPLSIRSICPIPRIAVSLCKRVLPHRGR